jgi:hypothetical protein
MSKQLSLRFCNLIRARVGASSRRSMPELFSHLMVALRLLHEVLEQALRQALFRIIYSRKRPLRNVVTSLRHSAQTALLFPLINQATLHHFRRLRKLRNENGARCAGKFALRANIRLKFPSIPPRYAPVVSEG